MYKKIVVSLSLLAIAPALGSEQARARNLFAVVTDLKNSHALRLSIAQELRKNALVSFLAQKEQETFGKVEVDLGLAKAAEKAVPKQETPKPAQTSSFNFRRDTKQDGYWELDSAGDRNIWHPSNPPVQESYEDRANRGGFPF